MKKIILVLLVILCSGCGKKLTCTYKENYEDVKISNKIVFNLRNYTYKEIDTMIFENEKAASEYFDDIKEYVEEYNLVLDKNKITSNIGGKMQEKNTKKELKEKYESYDYKCK